MEHPEWYDYSLFLYFSKKDHSGTFYRVEDNILLEKAEMSFSFKAKNKAGGEPYERIIALIKPELLKTAVKRLKSEFLN